MSQKILIVFYIAIVWIGNISSSWKKMWGPNAVKRMYNLLTSMMPVEMGFINWGFADSQPIELTESEKKDRYGIQLYHHVASQVDLKDREILEVSSGRGAGMAFVKRYFHPQRVVGLDFSERNLELCRQKYNDSGLEFVLGLAEKMPFGADSFDAVINIESDHLYHSRFDFYKEVYRVLRPGGYFLFAGIVTNRDRLEDIQHCFEKLGFQFVRREIINDQVIKACELGSSDRKKFVEYLYASKIMRALAYNFIGLPDSTFYNKLQSQEILYLSYTLKK